MNFCQLIYAGKSSRCLPAFELPLDWLISYTPNHWSNEATMISYIEEIIVPFVQKKREDLRVGENQSALAIFDHFKGQLTNKVTECLEKHNIQSALVPANCTDRLQPLDLSVNKAAKAFLQSQFQNWYAEEVGRQLTESDEAEPIDLSTPRMKCVGGQWLVKLFNYLSENPSVINNGFQAAHILQSIDAGKPVLGDVSSEVDSEDECEDSDEESEVGDVVSDEEGEVEDSDEECQIILSEN